MRRRVSSAATVLVVVLVSLTAAVPAVAADTNVQIRSVGVSVDQPAPGERVTFRVNVANLASSSGPVDLTKVSVRQGGREIADIGDAGTVAAGGNLSVPLTTSFENPGGKELTVYAVVEDEDSDTRRVSYPLYVEVERPDAALLSVGDLEPVAGQEGAVDLTVSNGDAAALSNVQLRLGGDVTVENRERVSASLAPGTGQTFTFRATFPEAGARSLDATLSYRTRSGSTRTVRRSFTVDVESATVDPTLRAVAGAEAGSSVIDAELRQFGNVDLRDVRVRALQDGDTVARTTMPDVAAEGTQTVALDSSTVPSGEVTVVAEFTASGERRSVRETLDYTSDVELDASNEILNGSSVVRAELRQFGNVELRDVEIRATSGGETVARAPVSDVPSGGSRTVTLGGEDIPAGNVTVVAAYTAGGGRQRVASSLQYSKYSPAPTSAITLTSVEVTRDGGVLTIDGDAANVGTTQVDSVLVSVAETDAARPVEPSREFFIETVGAGQFESFEATANVSAGVEEVPLRVEYTVGGQRVSTIIPVDVRRTTAGASGGGQAGSDGGSPLLGLGAVLLVMSAVGAVVYRRRKQ